MEKLKEFFLTSWCVENRTAVYFITVLVTAFGYMAYNSMPKEQFPDVVLPTISIVTIYGGASPEDIENLITKPLEKQIKSISGVKKITSNSLSDVSIITAEFDSDLKPADCKRKVQDAVDKGMNDLPSDLKDDPQITEFDINELPIMNINLAGDLPLHKLKDYAEDLEDRIEGMNEITRVDIIGGLDREIQVNVDMYKLTALGLTLADVGDAISRQNLNISGGEVRVDELRRNLRVTGQFTSASEIEDIVVRSFQGNTVVMKDFATVLDTYEDKQDFARLEGKPVVTLNVIKRSGENLIEASDKIYQTIEELKKSTFPDGLQIKITGDTSVETRLQLSDLINTVIIGFLLVLIILMFFMGFSDAFFVALSVPLASLVAFLILPGMDVTLNVVVLFAFLLALGIVVDDAIVVIENTHRIYHKYDFSLVQATKYAAGEVFIPVLSGTLTTLAPFVPLLFWPGIVGKFMVNLPITLIVTLFASLFVAFVMNPVFAVATMQKTSHEKTKKSIRSLRIPIGVLGLIAVIGYIANIKALGNLGLILIFFVLLHYFVLDALIHSFQKKFFPRLLDRYRGLLKRMIKRGRPFPIMLGAIGLLFGSFVLLFSFGPPVLFFPEADPNFVYVYLKMPLGTDAEVTDSITEIVENRIYKVIGKENPVVKSVISNVGLGAGDPQNPDKVPTPHKSKVTVAFVKHADRHGVSTVDILNSIRDELSSGVAAAEISVEKERNGPPVGKAVNIEIGGDDFKVLSTLQEVLKNEIARAGIKGIQELKSDLQISKPEIKIQIDKEKAQREGISVAQIAVEIRTALYGKEVSKFRDVDEDAPIMVRVDRRQRQRVEELMNLNISFMDMSIGQYKQIPVSSLATIQYESAISQINRKDQKRVITLASDVVEGANANVINSKIKDIIDGLELPEGYTIVQTGEQEQQQETADFLGVAFLGAFALMFLILTIQFNSIVKPLIIATTVVFSFIGVALGFTATQMVFSLVMTGVGIFALSGIVIRNGILLIEFIDELRGRGLEVEEAVVEGGATRLTPVILTAMAAMLGLVPLAVGLNLNWITLLENFNPQLHLGGDQVAFWGPLAWTMIFGLLVATFLTLLLVPTMYMMGYRTREKVYGWIGKKVPEKGVEEPKTASEKRQEFTGLSI